MEITPLVCFPVYVLVTCWNTDFAGVFVYFLESFFATIRGNGCLAIQGIQGFAP